MDESALSSKTYCTTPFEIRPCDVAVAGGGIAGVFASLGAASLGADVVLIEQHGSVGGQGTAGGVHTFCGETRLVNNPWREMSARLEQLNGLEEYRPSRDGRRFDIESLKYVLQDMLQEAGVRLLLHTQLVDVETQDDQVNGLILFNKSGLCRMHCKFAVDSTGDADLVFRAGFGTRKGGAVMRPGNPPTVDPDSTPLQLPMSLYFTMINTGRNVAPYLPLGCPTWERDDDLPMTTVTDNGVTAVVKMKVIGHDATDGESLSRAEQAGRQQMMGLVHYLQTRGYQGGVYSNYELAWTAPNIGIREGRRVIAQHELTQDDLFSGREWEDSIAVGSYHVDYHWPNVVQRAGTGITTQCPPYQIPLRALRPVGSSNVLVPGRCMSGEQMAMSSFRVMGTCAQTGFAAGTAAALAVQSTCSLDDLDISSLQVELKKGGVCFDLAPYTNYLRSKRSGSQTVCDTATEKIVAVSAAIMPDGGAVCVWCEEEGGTWRIRRSVRHEMVWSGPELVCETDAPSAVEVLLDDADRIFADGTEPLTESGGVPAYGDKTPTLSLAAGDRHFISSDGGRTWAECKPNQTTSPESAQSLSQKPRPTVNLVPSPGDPGWNGEGAPPLVQASIESSEGVLCLFTSFDNASTWAHEIRIATGCDPSVSPSLSSTPDGLSVVYVDNASVVKFVRLSLEHLTGERILSL